MNEEENKITIELPAGIYTKDRLYRHVEESISEKVYDLFGASLHKDIVLTNTEQIIGELISLGMAEPFSIEDSVNEYDYIVSSYTEIHFTTLHDRSRTWNINSLRWNLQRNFGYSYTEANWQVHQWMAQSELRRVGLARYRFKSKIVGLAFSLPRFFDYHLESKVEEEEVMLYMCTVSWMSGGGGARIKSDKYSTTRVIKAYAYLLKDTKNDEKMRMMRELMDRVLYEIGYPPVIDVEMWHSVDGRVDNFEPLIQPDSIQEAGYYIYVRDEERMAYGTIDEDEIAKITGVKVTADVIDKEKAKFGGVPQYDEEGKFIGYK